MNKVEQQLLKNLEASISDTRAHKDVSPHHIKAGISEILDNTGLPPEPDKPQGAVDIFLRDKLLENQSLADRIRHRANLMRERANEFDDIADLFERKQFDEFEKNLLQYEMTVINLLELLASHAHVEPKKEVV